MLPCDVNPEREMRQRFFKREAEMRSGFLVEQIDLIEAKDPLVRAFGFQDELGMLDWSSQFAREKKDITRCDRRRLLNKRPVVLVRFVNAAAAKKGTEAVKQFNGTPLGLKKLRKVVPALKLSEAVKMKVSTEPFWTVEVQFDKDDLVDPKNKPGMTFSFYDTFLRTLSAGRFDIEERFRERRMFIKVAAKSSKEAIKIINTFLVQANKVHAGAR